MTDKKMGRPPIDNPKNKKITIRVTQDEIDCIDFCAKQLNISKTDVLLKGVQLVKNSLKQEKDNQKNDLTVTSSCLAVKDFSFCKYYNADRDFFQ